MQGKPSFRIPGLVHNRVLNLKAFLFRFKDQDSIQNFSMKYIITSVENIDTITGTLSFIAANDEKA